LQAGEEGALLRARIRFEEVLQGGAAGIGELPQAGTAQALRPPLMQQCQLRPVARHPRRR
jgi:hypothetical protein